MKKIITLVLAFVLTAATAVGITLAYLQDSDSDVNVMTMGNVYIEQHEYERVVENGAWVSTGTTDKYGYTPDKVQEFTQAKPLLPAVFADGVIKWDDRNGSQAASGEGSHQQSWGQVEAPGSNQLFDDSVRNVQDKFVFVENTGKTDAYVRTVFAFEQGAVAKEDFKSVVMTNTDKAHWTWSEWIYDVEIDGCNYVIVAATYVGPSSEPNGVLAAKDTSYASLLQLYMRPEADNDDIIAIDGNENGTYDVLVVSQAVQTAGFDNAAMALDTAFGAISATSHPWIDGNVAIPEVTQYEGVNYIVGEDTATINAMGGNTVYRGVVSDGASDVTTVNVSEGITRLNDRAFCKAPTLTEVNLPDSLTYIDESVFQQSGITSIEIPENVTYIGKQAFGACGSLETIVINAKNVTIANYVARACANLKEVYIHSDSVTFEEGSMYFTNKENGDASGITFYVANADMADTLYSAFSTSHSYGMIIKSLDGATEFYNTLK